MLARKDRTEIASPFKVAMNDLTDLNPLGRKFLSDEKQAKRSSILLSSKEGERGENKIRGGGGRLVIQETTRSGRLFIRGSVFPRAFRGLVDLFRRVSSFTERNFAFGRFLLHI